MRKARKALRKAPPNCPKALRKAPPIFVSIQYCTYCIYDLAAEIRCSKVTVCEHRLLNYHPLINNSPAYFRGWCIGAAYRRLRGEAYYTIVWNNKIGGAFLRAFLSAFLAFLMAFLAFLRLFSELFKYIFCPYFMVPVSAKKTTVLIDSDIAQYAFRPVVHGLKLLSP